jgi:hypothetical protein
MLALAALLAAATTAPPELQAYYRDHNFVNAFSTVAERQLVVQFAPRDERLRRVAAAMARMERRVLEMDPGILYPRPRRWTPRAGQRPSDSTAALRADVVRITDLDVDQRAGEVWVHLEVTKMATPAQQLFISRFEEMAPGRRQPEAEDLLRAWRGPRVVAYEIHRWVLTDAGWRRDHPTRHFAGGAVVR